MGEALAQAIRRGKGSKVPIAEQVKGAHGAIGTGAQHSIAWQLAWKAQEQQPGVLDEELISQLESFEVRMASILPIWF